jgi:AcrR family transcriptional regulator
MSRNSSGSGEGRSVGTGTRRMTGEARKRQIVQVALETIGKYGVQGTTMARIAKGAGTTTAALYVHFENRQAILLAALDAVYEKTFELHRSSPSKDAVQQLRDICEYHAELIATQGTAGHAHLFLEFVAAATEDDLREALREKQLAAVKDMALIVDEGKRQGTIAKDVDSEDVAWMIGGWAWSGDIAAMMGVRPQWHPRVSSRLLESILRGIAPGACTS